MKTTILTMGSRGDLQPYIALGLALKEKGFRVRIATLLDFENFVRGYELEYFPVNGYLSKMVNSEVFNNARKVDNPIKFIKSFREMSKYGNELVTDLFDACQGEDLIIYHPGASIGFFAAQEQGIPSVLASPFPMTPTSEYPALIFYQFPSLGGVFNKITHKIFENTMWMVSNMGIKKYWINNFGKLPENFSSPFRKQSNAKAPTIISCSNEIFPTPKDGPKYIFNTGYWFLDEEPGWQPPQGLVEFLKDGPAPVYIGFGSVSDPALAEETSRIVVEALRLTGARGVLASGWDGKLLGSSKNKDIYLLDNAPHSWLFPRMSGVVHHGGAGTTAAGLRAGIPSVIIPHSNDQFAWGKRIFELGVGSRPIARKNLNSENLASAIQKALKDDVRNAAFALGKKIRSENGVENAAKIIMNIFQ